MMNWDETDHMDAKLAFWLCYCWVQHFQLDKHSHHSVSLTASMLWGMKISLDHLMYFMPSKILLRFCIFATGIAYGTGNKWVSARMDSKVLVVFNQINHKY